MDRNQNEVIVGDDGGRGGGEGGHYKGIELLGDLRQNCEHRGKSSFRRSVLPLEKAAQHSGTLQDLEGEMYGHAMPPPAAQRRSNSSERLQRLASETSSIWEKRTRSTE